MKYVKCINTEDCPQLVEGNIYRVVEERKFIYLIDKGTGFTEQFDKSRFVEVSVRLLFKGHCDPKGPEGELPDTPITPKHYKRGIETWDYTDSWGMDFLEGSIIKYVTRWRDKNGIEDLKKANQFLLRLIEREEKKNEI